MCTCPVPFYVQQLFAFSIFSCKHTCAQPRQVINLCGTGWINEPSQVEVSGFVLVGVCVSSVSHEVAQFPGFSLFSVCLYETDLLGALHGHMFYQITCPLTSLLLH